jgi:hypothetical protein
VEKKRYIEVTAELRMKGKQHVCYLHKSEEPYPERFTMWAPRDAQGGPMKPGFYAVDPNGVFIREQQRPSDDGKRMFRDQVLSVGGLVFVSASNPLAAPAPTVAPQAPVRPAATARAA